MDVTETEFKFKKIKKRRNIIHTLININFRSTKFKNNIDQMKERERERIPNHNF